MMMYSLTFYKKYMNQTLLKNFLNEPYCGNFDHLPSQSLTDAMKKMSNKKAADDSGNTLELIKYGPEELHVHLLCHIMR